MNNRFIYHRTTSHQILNYTDFPIATQYTANTNHSRHSMLWHTSATIVCMKSELHKTKNYKSAQRGHSGFCNKSTQ